MLVILVNYLIWEAQFKYTLLFTTYNETNKTAADASFETFAADTHLGERVEFAICSP